LDTVKRIRELGVLHNDFSLGNILFTFDGRSTRAVIIDFADSGMREDKDDDEWANFGIFEWRPFLHEPPYKDVFENGLGQLLRAVGIGLG